MANLQYGMNVGRRQIYNMMNIERR